MESLLEKVTLYDFFSYFIPGALCLALCACGIFPELTHYQGNIGETFEGYIGFTLIIFSYVGGIGISSIARLICTQSLCKCKRWFHELRVDGQTLKNALIESGVSQENIESVLQNVSEEKTGMFLAERFSEKIYADIQIDPKYRRIHNYSSSESMYKNIAFSFLIGGAVPCFLKHFLQVQILEEFSYLLVLEIGMAVVFLIRWKRFERKKKSYALVWFLEKYNNDRNESEENN